MVKSEVSDAFKKYWEANGKSTLPYKDTKAILKFILPQLAPDENMSSYITGSKAMWRLEQYATDSGNEITWESEMENFLKDDKEMQQGEL